MNNKILLFVTLLSASVIFLNAQTLTTTLENHHVTVGEPAYLSLSVDSGSAPHFIGGAPRVSGISWYGTSTNRNVQIINGRYKSSTKVVYTFVATRPGKYVIPASKVLASGKQLVSQPIRFTAEAPQISVPVQSSATGTNTAQQSVKLDDLVFANIVLPKRKVFMAGEEIPVEVRLYSVYGLNIATAYPVITAVSKTPLIFHDYGKLNPKNPSFEQPDETRAVIRNRNYSCYIFRTAVRTVDSGKLQLAASFQVVVRVCSNSRRTSGSFFDDDFFDSFFDRGRTIQQTISVKSPEAIQIKPLPPPPETARFTGLIGDWVLSAKLSSETAKTGDALTLTVFMDGDTSSASLKPPMLEFPGFRVYPPETERTPGGRTVLLKYILIPTEPGEKEIAFKMASFKPEQEKYEVFTFQKKVKIAQGSSAPALAPPSTSEKINISRKTHKNPDTLLYLKKKNEFKNKVFKPYYLNTLIPCLCILLAGLVFRIICEILRSRRLAHEQDPGFRRKQNARHSKSKLLAELRSMPPEKIAEKSSEIASFAADAMDLPPGATLSDAAEKTEERLPALSKSLKALSELSWRPGGASGFTEEMKKELIRGLGKLIAAAFILFLPAADALEVKSHDSAMAAYDAGNFKQAYDYYAGLTSAAAPIPAVYYNLGNCQFQMGNYAGALANYELAMRLSPRDSDLLENLNLTRRKLGLPEKYQLNAPGDVPVFLRDSLRPDEWYLLIAAGLSLLLIGDGLRRIMTGSRFWLFIVIPGALLVVFSVTAVLSQNATSYADNQAFVITEKGIHLRSLPSEAAPELGTVLSPGEEVRIEDHRNHWLRVRSGETEGWISESRISRL